MFSVRDQVIAKRNIKAGLSEDGPEICAQGAKGVVINIDPREPDGIHVELYNGIKWWFKPNQLEVLSE